MREVFLVVDRGHVQGAAITPDGKLALDFESYRFYEKYEADEAFDIIQAQYPMWPFARVDTFEEV